MIKVRVLGHEATLDDEIWTSEDKHVEMFLNNVSRSHPIHGYEPNPEWALAKYILSIYKGEIIYDSNAEMGKGTSDPDVAY